jgi:hypothetical protein
VFAAMEQKPPTFCFGTDAASNRTDGQIDGKHMPSVTRRPHGDDDGRAGALASVAAEIDVVQVQEAL